MKKIIFILIVLIFTRFSFAEEPPKPRYPAVMVLMDNYIDDVKDPRHIAAGEIEKSLRENKFPVVENRKIRDINLRDFMPVYTVAPEKIAKIGRKYKTDVVIVGRATCNREKSDLSSIFGKYTYKARIEARIIRVDNALVIAMDKVLYVTSGNDKTQVADLALAGCARNLSKSLTGKISEIWKKEIFHALTMRIICENANPNRAELFERALNFMKGVENVKESSFVNNLLTLEVKYLGTSDELVRLLRQLVQPVIDITGNTDDTVHISFVKKRKDFTSNILRFH